MLLPFVRLKNIFTLLITLLMVFIVFIARLLSSGLPVYFVSSFGSKTTTVKTEINNGIAIHILTNVNVIGVSKSAAKQSRNNIKVNRIAELHSMILYIFVGMA